VQPVLHVYNYYKDSRHMGVTLWLDTPDILDHNVPGVC